MKRTALVALAFALAAAGCSQQKSRSFETASLGSPNHVLVVSKEDPEGSRALALAAIAERPASIAPTTSFTPTQTANLSQFFKASATTANLAPCSAVPGAPHTALAGGATGGFAMSSRAVNYDFNSNAAMTAVSPSAAATAGKVAFNPGSIGVLGNLGSLGNLALSLTDPTPQRHDTSEFMAGSVAVRIVLVDSPNEKFSSDDSAAALADTREAMGLWERELPQSHLSFLYEVDHASVTGTDPIKLPIDQRYGWLTQAEAQLLSSGATGDFNEDAYELDRRARAAYGTDWAVTYFMVKAASGLGDLIHGQAMFPDGWGAYTMLGGPYGVFPYSRVWGAHFWNPPIIAHELAHFFYALDEYKKYYDMGHRANETTGYLCVDNHNLDGDPTSTMDEHCLMRGSFAAVMDYIADHLWELVTFGGFHWDYNICSSSLAQIAATRTPDGRTPPTDLPPIVMASLTRDAAGNLAVSGQTACATLGNKNPYDNTVHPGAERKDLSIDAIAGAQVAWQLAPGISLGFITLPPVNAFVANVPVPAGAKLADLTSSLPSAVPAGSTIVVTVTGKSGLVGTQTFTAP